MSVFICKVVISWFLVARAIDISAWLAIAWSFCEQIIDIVFTFLLSWLNTLMPLSNSHFWVHPTLEPIMSSQKEARVRNRLFRWSSFKMKCKAWPDTMRILWVKALGLEALLLSSASVCFLSGSSKIVLKHFLTYSSTSLSVSPLIIKGLESLFNRFIELQLTTI